MSLNETILKVDGEVSQPLALSRSDFASIETAYQIADAATLDPTRRGRAVWLEGILALARPTAEGDYLTPHAEKDDFHASVPLEKVRGLGFLIYELDGDALDAQAGGPVRFYIPASAECQTAEVDECANVKFVDHLEITAGRGRDNRPSDDDEHEALHRGT